MRAFGFLAGAWLCLVTLGHADDLFTKVPAPNFTGYIVQPSTESLPLIRASLGGNGLDADGGWAPSVRQAMEAEIAARNFIRRATKDLHLAFPQIVSAPEKFTPEVAAADTDKVTKIYANYSQYGIQFIGVRAHGRKVILCNYFDLRSPSLDPATRLVMVNDGGSGFWHVEYDPARKSCSHFEVNGP